MRLMHMIADGGPGGGTTFVIALMDGLREPGVDLCLVSQKDSYALDRAMDLGIKVEGVQFFRSRLDPSVPLRLRRLVQRHRPELIHVHGSRAGGFFGVVPAAHGLPAIVYTVHGYHFRHKSKGVRHLGALAERLASRRADVTVFVCEYDRRLAGAWQLLPRNKKSVVIPNGVRTASLPLGSRVQPKCIGFLGRLTGQKDPLLFVEIVRLLASEGYSAKIVGGGQLHERVRSLVETYGLSNQVEMLGDLPRETALAAISDVGVLVFPSRWEGMPLAPMEVMQMGIPVVAAEVGGVPEIIESGVSGILVRDREPLAYAEAVRRVTEDSRLRARMIEAARRVIQRRFNLDRVVEQYRLLYRAVLREKMSGA